MLSRMLIGAALLAAALFAAPARAEFEVSYGRVDEIEGVFSNMGTFAWQFGDELHWELMAGFIAERDEIEPEGYADSHTFVALSRRYYLFDSRWFLSGGIAAASGDDDDEVLSGTLQFLTGGGWQGEHWALSLRHMSNANTTGRNRGETFLLLGYRW